MIGNVYVLFVMVSIKAASWRYQTGNYMFKRFCCWLWAGKCRLGMYLKFEKNELKRFEPNSHFLYIRSEQRKFQTVFQFDIFYLNCYFIHEVFNSSPTYVAAYFVSSRISDTQKLDEFYSISSSYLKSISLLEVKPANRWN